MIAREFVGERNLFVHVGFRDILKIVFITKWVFLTSLDKMCMQLVKRVKFQFFAVWTCELLVGKLI